MSDNQKPFDKSYVMKTTVEHMRKCVDVSIRKTFARSAEFSGTDKNAEVFETLSELHNIRHGLDTYLERN